MINKVNPKNLFHFRRLDLIAKYLFARDILNKNNNDYLTDIHKDLYIRTIIMRTMGVEPLNQYSNNIKNYVDDYINSFNELINSIKKNDFIDKYPIPYSSINKLLFGGSHRIAASMALNKEVYIDFINEAGISWDFNWFSQNGFTNYDKMRLLHGFIELNIQNSGILILWNPMFKYIGNIRKIINKYCDIVGEVDLDFENNYIAFTNIILDIYEPNIKRDSNETTILRKIELLKFSYLSFKVIVVTNQDKNNNTDIHELVLDIKNNIRNAFDFEIPKQIFATMHSSDSINEVKYLSNILLSPNNIEHIKLRKDYKYNLDFLQRVRNLSNFINKIGIENLDEICCIGSSVMTALGIKTDSNDLDFIVKSKYREKFGYNSVQYGEYDIGVSDVMREGRKIIDDLQIYDSDYHFYFKGVKFINLDILKDRKKNSNKEKDFLHLRLIDLYEKLQGNFEQRKILFDRIEKEKEIRAGIIKGDINTSSNNIVAVFNKIINMIAWWIPIRKWRDGFRNKFKIIE